MQGIVTDTSPLSENALSPIVVTSTPLISLGITKFVYKDISTPSLNPFIVFVDSSNQK